MRRWPKRGAILAMATSAILIVGYVYYQYRYPYGWSHCCDKLLQQKLFNYADLHDEWFPQGEITPEASLSLLYRQDPTLLETLRGKSISRAVVEEQLDRDKLLSPDTCGWYYIEGLRKDDDPRIALFWDKTGLGHNGERLTDGGHWVCFVSGTIDYVPGAVWESFLAEQARLRSRLIRKK